MLSYAACEGLVVGAFSFVVANVMVSGISAGALISQAVVGTLGVFFGMLVVYKTGAIRVTPKFTRFLVAAGFGAVVLMLVNLVIGLFTHSAGPLRDGGPMAILFSLSDDRPGGVLLPVRLRPADQAIRAGAPEKAAWGIALGLTVTLVWLYLEILRPAQLLQQLQPYEKARHETCRGFYSSNLRPDRGSSTVCAP